MSALGAVPGYGYPPLDYSQAEFYFAEAPSAPAIVGSTLNYRIATAENGQALYIRDINFSANLSASANQRNCDLVFFDPDGSDVTRWRQPLVGTANSQPNWSWSVGVSTSYYTANVSVSPMQQIVLPPGWFVDIEVFGADGGDTWNNAIITGLTIPTLSSGQNQTISTAPPLLT